MRRWGRCERTRMEGAVVRRLVGLLGLLVLAACGAGIGLPSNKAFFDVQNHTGAAFRLILEDTPRSTERDGAPVKVIRVWDRGVLVPGKGQWFQWPFAAETGRIGAVVGVDTSYSPWVRPWTKKVWRWKVLENAFELTTEER